MTRLDYLNKAYHYVQDHDIENKVSTKVCFGVNTPDAVVPKDCYRELQLQDDYPIGKAYLPVFSLYQKYWLLDQEPNVEYDRYGPGQHAALSQIDPDDGINAMWSILTICRVPRQIRISNNDPRSKLTIIKLLVCLNESITQFGKYSMSISNLIPFKLYKLT
jgi:hypothetical protein